MVISTRCKCILCRTFRVWHRRLSSSYHGKSLCSSLIWGIWVRPFSLAFPALQFGECCGSLFAEVAVVLKNVVNPDNLPHVAVCPLHIELLGLEQFDHVLLFCFDGECGVNSVAACQNVLAFEVWVPACLEHYLPECFLISHNANQYIRISGKVNPFFHFF